MKPAASRAGGQMLAEVIPPKILPRNLTKFDLIAIYFALIFGSYGASQMAAQGWAGIPMMALAAVTFLLPVALASYELGTLFPGEGGIYIWAHKTMGPVHGFIAGWLSWVPIFLLIPLGASVIVAHLQLAFGIQLSLSLQVMAQIACVVVVTGISITRLKTSQKYVKVLFFVSAGTAIAVLIAGLVKLAGGGGSATPVDSEIVSLDFTAHGSLYSAAILWLLGVEVPFNMGAEFKDHKETAGKMLLWGSVALLAGYFFGIAGILFTTPLGEVNVTTGVAAGVGRVFPLLGPVVAVAIAFAVSSQDVTYMNAYSRLLFVSGVEKRLPELMAQVNDETRTPVPAILVQALGAIVIILIFSSQPRLEVVFNLYLAALVAVWTTSLFYLYVGIVRARRLYVSEYKKRASEVWRMPGGGIGLAALVIWGVAFNVVAIYYVFAIPWVGGVTTSQWVSWLSAIALVVIVSGVMIFVGGKKRVEAATLEEELRKYARFDDHTGSTGG